MDAETLEALNGSIAKWEAIIAGTAEDHGTDDCPLCQLFVAPRQAGAQTGHLCDGCPVAASGHRGCQDTPYIDYRRAVSRDYAIGMDRHARGELDFLKSLLPADAKHER